MANVPEISSSINEKSEDKMPGNEGKMKGFLFFK